MTLMSRIDLHLHTTYSDGSFTPEEVLKRAAAASVTTAAITDHDTIDGISDAMASAAGLGIELIPGIELSARYPEADVGTELHILGYFVDWQSIDLQTKL